MGLLTQGAPLEYDEALEAGFVKYVKEHGVEQFLVIFNRLKDRKGDQLYWGDEVEYQILTEKDKTFRLSLRAKEIISELENDDDTSVNAAWRPEYGMYMIEGTPGWPYKSRSTDMLAVEANLGLRRKKIESVLRENERVITLSAYPHLGVGDFTDPSSVADGTGPAALSMYISDDCINNHPRFRTLTRNIRTRKGKKVAINIPIFEDKETVLERNGAKVQRPHPDAKADHIYMDCMCFGMGLCCLQVTFQATDLKESLWLYDQLAIMCPPMLALSAGTPILKGVLADADVRWSVIAQSVDDRTEEELGKTPLKNNDHVINKSRYDSVDWFISSDPRSVVNNDLPVVYDQKTFERLKSEGVPEPLAYHVAHLFIRDPLVIYRELVDVDDKESSDHFENIQSTNWQTVRWKPPPPGTEIGWRVEFRPMEVQLTDFENAAFIVFTLLVSRVILTFNLDLSMPMSKVEENHRRALKRDAINTQKFWFRRVITGEECEVLLRNRPRGSSAPPLDSASCNDLEEMTLNEIMNGKPECDFPGLVNLTQQYLDYMECDIETRCIIGRYLSLISRRASGELLSTAGWLRKFVQTHPAYKHDSMVCKEISDDLVAAVHKIGRGEMEIPELTGGLHKPCSKGHESHP